MSEWNSCPTGTDDCGISHVEELALTHEILELITRFSSDKRIDPDPFLLRDTMLTVAALLHLEGEKLAGARIGHPINWKHANRAFSQVARERFDDILEADAIRAAWRNH